MLIEFHDYKDPERMKAIDPSLVIAVDDFPGSPGVSGCEPAAERRTIHLRSHDDRQGTVSFSVSESYADVMFKLQMAGVEVSS